MEKTRGRGGEGEGGGSVGEGKGGPQVTVEPGPSEPCYATGHAAFYIERRGRIQLTSPRLSDNQLYSGQTVWQGHSNQFLYGHCTTQQEHAW